MNSSAGFENTASTEKGGAPRKKTVSTGLWVVFIFLLLVIGAWLFLDMRNKSLKEDVKSLESQIMQANKDINTALSQKDADFAMRAYTMEKDLYRKYEVNDILDIIESIMVVQTTGSNIGDRVVLKSFQYGTGQKMNKASDDATNVGAGSIIITADADSFDVMAQQIKAFKEAHYVNEELLAQIKSEGGIEEEANVYYFNNVIVGSTDRDDLGRIIFTVTMDVIPFGTSPYENTDDIVVVEQPKQETQAVEVLQDEEMVNVTTEDTKVTVDENGVEINTETLEIVPDNETSVDNVEIEGDTNDVSANTL
jgi:hypothetical protein